MLVSPPGTRLMYEPANVSEGVVTGEQAATTPLPEGAHPATLEVIRALQGGAAFHGAWIDQLNTAHLVRRTVVKDVRAMAIAAEVRRYRPHNPVIVLTRHPFEIARSVVALGWYDPASKNPFLDEVEQWCQRHHSVFLSLRDQNVHFVAYEELLNDAKGQLAAIGTYAMAIHPTWRKLNSMAIDVTRPSSTNFRDSSAFGPTSWSDIDKNHRRSGLEILTRYTMTALYSDEPGCKMPLADFVANYEPIDPPARSH